MRILKESRVYPAFQTQLVFNYGKAKEMVILKTSEIKEYLYSKGFVDDGGGVGCSYVNYYYNDSLRIVTCDEDATMDAEQINPLLIALEDDTFEDVPVGVCLDSKFPFMQFAASNMEMAKEVVENIFVAFEIYEKLRAITKLTHEQALLTALESAGFKKTREY